jgi:hypothetical protein
VRLVPNIDEAYIDPRKIVDYLLSPTHPQGAGKAAFFHRFGFSRDRPGILETALRWHGRSHEVTRTETTAYGVHYEVSGPLMSPDGRNPHVLVVWIIKIGEQIPRLVTVVPAKASEP